MSNLPLVALSLNSDFWKRQHLEESLSLSVSPSFSSPLYSLCIVSARTRCENSWTGKQVYFSSFHNKYHSLIFTCSLGQAKGRFRMCVCCVIADCTDELFLSCGLWDGQQSYPSFIMNIIHSFITNIIEVRTASLLFFHNEYHSFFHNQYH
jgi:hypothetical protein